MTDFEEVATQNLEIVPQVRKTDEQEADSEIEILFALFYYYCFLCDFGRKL